MSTSVASGSSLKAHSSSRRGHVGDRATPRSTSPDIDDQDSVLDLEDELQQELENEMSASYDNLFGDDNDDDDDFDSRSATGRSATAEFVAVGLNDNESVVDNNGASDSDSDEDDEFDAALFGDGSALDSNDDVSDLDFVDPPVGDGPKSGGLASIDDEDSASDDEFEAVEFNADVAKPPSRCDAAIVSSLSTVEAGQKRRQQDRIHIGDCNFLDRYKNEEPSMILHLFELHFRFEGQEGVFLYSETMRFFFTALNEGRIPVDLVDVFSELNCRYYEGCLLVEVRDHRRPPQEVRAAKRRTSELLTSSAFRNSSYGYRPMQRPADEPLPNTRSLSTIPEPGATAAKSLLADAFLCGSGSTPTGNASTAPKIFRKVMRPTSETLYIELLLASEQAKLSQADLLDIEAKLLLATEEVLDLEPDVQVSRIANATRYIEYQHMLPRKRCKYNSAEIEAEQAEREEKLKLMTLMDDRAGRSDFIPNFSLLSRITECRHKKYVGDAEVYPSATPPVPPLAPGRKAAARKNRSQMSLLPDGRKVIRTLRFVQVIGNRSTHTVFHVFELPEDGGLQGMMRWGTLPDTAINGGSKVFPFPNDEVMRIHIDNVKLLLSMENNRLIYDSAYPNGVPTAGPPPSLSVPTVSPRTSTNMVVTTGSGAAGAGFSSVAGPVTNASSPTAASSSAMPSPDISSNVSPSVTKSEASAPKAKTSVAKRGSRKNSPQPKQKNTASAEPETDDAPQGSSASRATALMAKGAGKGTADSSKRPAKEESPASVSSADSVSALAEPVSPVDEGDDVPALVTPALPRSKNAASRASLASSSSQAIAVAAAESTDPSTSGKASAKKGAKQTSRASAVPKERKPRAKAKAKSASVAPPSEAEALEASALPPVQGSADGLAKALSDDDDDDDDVPLVQNSGATSARVSGDETPAVSSAAPLLMSPSPLASSFSAIGNSPATLAPAQSLAAMAQLGANMANLPQGRPPFASPLHITKEYLQANPEQINILRMKLGQLAMQKQLRLQQQMQMQHQAASNMNGPSAGPMGSPQMRPIVAHPGMAAMAQMAQTMQNGPSGSGNPVPPGLSPSASATNSLTPGLPGQVAPANNPVIGSPAMRPAPGPGPSNVITAAQQQFLQQQQHLQLQPTKEEMIIIHQYCRLQGIQIQGMHDHRLPVLVAKAKTGELKAMLMASMQAINAQRQQMAAGPNPHARPSGTSNSMPSQQPIHGAPAQNSPALATSLPPNGAPTTPAMGGVILPPSAGLSQAVRPMQLPRDSATPNLQDRNALLEIMQRQREAQISGAVAGTQIPTMGAPNQQQQQLAAALQQRQQQLNMAAAAAGGGGNAAMTSPAGAVSVMQASMVRPMQPSGATVAPQSRPAAPMMGSLANAPQAMTAEQRLAFQQQALANMTPQQQKELFMRMQARQQAVMAPQQLPQANIAAIIQQISSGQLNPTMLSPQVIGFLLMNAQAQLTPEQRATLQRLMSMHMQHSQNNTAQAGPVRPGAAQ
ncbi:Transcription factor spt20 [Coemansia sp. RSA 2050]|nr:Transcription factor spt20 [Coemansia sp. RSA 2050]KAJ2735414.1 Transcription factor spt20 [Coemansia sp. BCRC 34962]